jgi:UDP-glucose 4-epimerase
MVVLVTGGAGYIGSHMALALLDSGREVVVIDSLSTGVKANVPEPAVFIEGDVGNEELVLNTIKKYRVDSVVHFAASTVVPESVLDPLAYYRNNTQNTMKLVEQVVKGGVERFVFSSTAAVYGNVSPEPVSEIARPEPESPYGASKLMSERVISDAAMAHGFSAAILRYFNVAGADPMGRSGQSTPRATHLIKVCAEAAVGRRTEVVVHGRDFPTPDGTGIRDFIHVSDLASAHMVALEAMKSRLGVHTINCGYGRGFSVMDVIETVKRVSGTDFPVRTGPRRLGDLASVVADSTRLRVEFGWVPRYDSLNTIVEHALNWEGKALG